MILGIESSCDESALALLDPHLGLGEWIHSQLDLHREYGGVVPELASREHLETFPVLLEKVMDKVKGLSAKIEEIAVTCGPGLAPCLALGVSVSRALALSSRFLCEQSTTFEGMHFRSSSNCTRQIP